MTARTCCSRSLLPPPWPLPPARALTPVQALAPIASTPPQTTQPAPVPRSRPRPLPHGTPDPWAAWCSGGGYGDLEAVSADLQVISADAGNGQNGSAAQEGYTLDEAAAAGQLDSPPESRARQAEYVNWMKEAGFVGAAMAQYDPSTATYSADQAQRYRRAVQEASDKCARNWADSVQMRSRVRMLPWCR